MEEIKTIEYVVGALGLLFFIGMGVVLGYLWNELRWRNKENKKDMVELVAGHIESTEDIEDYMNREEICADDKGIIKTPSSLKNLRQKE